jgi:HPt (histidine-containing phosphotransfer) domain-containing protein
MTELSPPATPPVHAGQAEPGVLDAAALARLRELDPDGRHGVLVRVFEAFEASLVRLQRQLPEQLACGDAAGAGALAHALKSSSASVGAHALSHRCALLERAARTGPAEALEPLARAVLDEVVRVAGAVRAMRTG